MTSAITFSFRLLVPRLHVYSCSFYSVCTVLILRLLLKLVKRPDFSFFAGLLRCGKSCRLRWTNYLRPDIKRGPFTPEEEKLVIQLHAILGNRYCLPSR